MFVFVQKQEHSENFTFLIYRILKIFTTEVLPFLEK